MEALKNKLAGMARYTTPTTKAKDRRSHLVEQFLERINNQERRDAGYKDVTPARIGVMVAHIKTDDLEAFYKQCSDYRGGFSKAFFGALKVKK